MTRLSSNLTLFFKIFIPTIWISFFGAFTAAVFLSDSTTKPLLANPYFKFGVLAFFVIFVLFLRFTLMTLLRVEKDSQGVIVTNYFKTFKYTFDSIENVRSFNFLFFELATIRMKAKTAFGRKIRFLAKKSNFRDFKQSFQP